MRGPLSPAAGLALLAALALAVGCSAGDDAADANSASSAPATAYAPYVNASTASGTDAAGSPTTYNLAFVISSGGGCTPGWDGVQDVDDAQVTSRIAGLTRSGADVRVSFGGAHGDELAAACDTPRTWPGRTARRSTRPVPAAPTSTSRATNSPTPPRWTGVRRRSPSSRRNATIWR